MPLPVAAVALAKLALKRKAVEVASNLPWAKIIVGAVVTVVVGAMMTTMALLGLSAVGDVAASQDASTCAVQAQPAAFLVSGFTETQSSHASTMVTVGRQRAQAAGLGPAATQQFIKIGLMTVAQESMFKNYANDGVITYVGGKPDLAPEQRDVGRSMAFPHDAVGSDHGSIGMVQQQYPWWGTIEQLMDPAFAAGAFYDRLLTVTAWQNLPLTVAAQRVQRSAFPTAYAKWEGLADQILAASNGAPAATAAVQQAALTVSATGACVPAAPVIVVAGGEIPAGGRSVEELVAFGQQARARGYTVSENGLLGDYPSPVHSPTGYHYKFGGSGAIDVNAGCRTCLDEQQKLAHLAQEAMNQGYGVIFMSAGHYNHLHIDIGTYRRVGDLSALLASGNTL